MKENKQHHVCPVENAGILVTIFRKLIHNPAKILKGLISEGITMLDFGSGPGFFTVEAAQMVGDSGKVIAADLQQGMLDILQKRISGKKIESCIKLHKCSESGIGISEQVDFVLIFYVLHEVPSQEMFFTEIMQILKPGGKVLLVEPKFHITKQEFEKSVEIAKAHGLKPVESRKIFYSRSVLFSKLMP
jgi:ubiquinone/menaquinone biosynthesis C-methylase UbiE